jgi:AcrR family transcriptional regulator
MNQPTARDRILDTAKRLFYRDGLRATGIDKIIAESGVAKMSLYRHFPSKNDLIAAFLDWRHAHWTTWFTEAVEARWTRTPTLCVLADVLGAWFEEDDFRGCAFINAVAETGGADAADVAGASQRTLAQRHKAGLEAYIAELAVRLQLSAPALVAQEAMLCIDGMIVRAQFQRDPQIVAAGRRLLARIENDGKRVKAEKLDKSGKHGKHGKHGKRAEKVI